MEVICSKMSDWKQRAIANSTVLPDWKRRAIEGSDIFGETPVGPDPNDIDDSAEAPAMVRMQVGALDKPDDRVKALRRFFPDAIPDPTSDGNFLYTNPETGRTNRYNSESWIPSLGDFASITPEIVEGGAGIVGGAIGGAKGAAYGGGTGALAGTAFAPGPGSVIGGVSGATVGGVGGAMAGAGLGAAVGRDLTQRGLNWYFDNEDTRTGGEQALDALKTAGVNAVGEGVGRGVAAVGGKLYNAGKQQISSLYNRAMIGLPDDIAGVAAREADANALGMKLTRGMSYGDPKVAKLEHAVSMTTAGRPIMEAQEASRQGLSDAFDRTVTNISPHQSTRAGTGAMLKEQMQSAKEAAYKRSEDLYDRVGELIVAPAETKNTTALLQGLKEQRAAFGEFDAIARGSQIDTVIKNANALVNDSAKGMSFERLKRARTHIGKLQKETEDGVLNEELGNLYAALTKDMEETALASGEEAAQAWRKANNQYRRTATTFDKKTDIGKVLTKESDYVYDHTFGAAAQKGGNRLSQYRRVIERSEGGREKWNQIVSSVIEDC